MSIQLTRHLPGAPGAAAVGATGAAKAAAALSRIGNGVWRAMAASGNARAERELRRLAAQQPADSELGRLYRAAVRNMLNRDC